MSMAPLGHEISVINDWGRVFSAWGVNSANGVTGHGPGPQLLSLCLVTPCPGDRNLLTCLGLLQGGHTRFKPRFANHRRDKPVVRLWEPYGYVLCMRLWIYPRGSTQPPTQEAKSTTVDHFNLA